jgi:hypothetical protein
MGVWSVFGVSESIALIVPYAIGFIACCLLIRFVRLLRPDDPELPFLVTALFCGSLPFIIYVNMIMFDVLLTACVIFGLTSIWQFAKTGRILFLALYGLAIGLGVLAKGPVILLHLLWPVVLAPLWISNINRPFTWAKWSGGFMAALLLGAVIALSWAIPAAIKGGPEFTHKIFWGQTAGRVANAFDHERPFWWYLPYIFLFAMPWIFYGSFLKSLKNSLCTVVKSRKINDEATRFLLCFIVPVFLSFCFVSGKQLHYLLPLVPAVFVLIAFTLRNYNGIFKRRMMIVPLVFSSLLTLAAFIAKILPEDIISKFQSKVHLQDSIDRMSSTLSIGLFILAMLVVFSLRSRQLHLQVMAISLSMLIAMSSFMLEARLGFFENYDLNPIARVIEKNPEIPLAFVRNYHGEWGFLARLDRPVKQLLPDDLPGWFKENPKGMAFIRTRDEREFGPYDILFSMPYKLTNTYAIVVPRGRLSQYQK